MIKKVSIVTATYNSAKTIERSIRSIIQQNIHSLEHVIIDGDSVDDTLDIIEGYRHIYHSKDWQLIIVSERDSGIYDAFNKGIDLCTGELIGILNSDDAYCDNSLENVLKAFNNTPKYSIIYGFQRHLRDNMEIAVTRHTYENFLMNFEYGILSAAQHPTCFVSKSCYDDFGLFDTRFRTAADYELLLRFTTKGASFIKLDLVITDFYFGGASTTVPNWELRNQKNIILLKYGAISRRTYQRRVLKIVLLRIKAKLRWPIVL